MTDADVPHPVAPPVVHAIPLSLSLTIDAATKRIELGPSRINPFLAAAVTCLCLMLFTAPFVWGAYHAGESPVAIVVLGASVAFMVAIFAGAGIAHQQSEGPIAVFEPGAGATMTVRFPRRDLVLTGARPLAVWRVRVKMGALRTLWATQLIVHVQSEDRREAWLLCHQDHIPASIPRSLAAALGVPLIERDCDDSITTLSLAKANPIGQNACR